jgi:hypothetical protein
MNRIHLDQLLRRALCHGDTDDADGATIALYLDLLQDVQPAVGDADAPCIVATLMFAMARRLLAGPGSTPPTAALASLRRAPEPIRLAA